MKLPRGVCTFVFCTASACFQIATAPNALAGTILGTDLNAFALLGGAGVAINGTGSVITGSIGGCCNAVAVTGVIPTNFTDSGGVVYTNPPFSTLPTSTEISAQGQLGTAITALNNLTPVISESSLNNITLGPGVYSIGAMTLTGTLTLDGFGNANALWVFLESSTLTTASGSSVIVQGTGAGAGVYWVMGVSAVLGSNSTFEGNILANQSITAATGVTDSCGRLLTQVASVTLAGSDTIGIGCSGSLAGSGGLSGGGTLSVVNGIPAITSLPSSSVPEPSAFFLVASCLAGFVIRRKRSRSMLTKSAPRTERLDGNCGNS
jgi:hypothetical protein